MNRDFFPKLADAKDTCTVRKLEQISGAGLSHSESKYSQTGFPLRGTSLFDAVREGEFKER